MYIDHRDVMFSKRQYIFKDKIWSYIELVDIIINFYLNSFQKMLIKHFKRIWLQFYLLFVYLYPSYFNSDIEYINYIHLDSYPHFDSDIVSTCKRLFLEAIGENKKSDSVTLAFNCLGWQRKEVVTINSPSGNPAKKQRKSLDEKMVQHDKEGNTLGTISFHNLWTFRFGSEMTISVNYGIQIGPHSSLLHHRGLGWWCDVTMVQWW